MTSRDVDITVAALAVFVAALLLHAPMFVPTCCGVGMRAVLRALATSEKQP